MIAMLFPCRIVEGRRTFAQGPILLEEEEDEILMDFGMPELGKDS